MRPITVHLLKPGSRTTIRYEGMLQEQEPGHLLVYTHWQRDALDLGYVVFAPGDVFLEHYYTDRWYNVYEVRGPDGRLKGWYCNIARPAYVEADILHSEDLALDLFVAPDRTRLLKLDEDEFAALALDLSDPPAYAAALYAFAELEQLARSGAPPFDSK